MPIKNLLCLLAALTATSALAQDWQSLPPPAIDSRPLLTNPLRGLYGWEGGIVPLPRPSSEDYQRFAWADLELREGVYDFSKIDAALNRMPKGNRLAFGILMMDTCCSGHKGDDIPPYLKAHMPKGFRIKADPGNYGHVDTVYVPDWNSPYLLDRWQKLFAALGRHFDGDPRIAWVDLRGYGNWGEGHVAGANAYHWSQFPYDDPAVNLNGAAPGALDSRIALVDAIIDAFPHTQLIAMTDDKAVLVHALKRSPRIGMRRDSWGARMFGESLLGDLTGLDRDLVLSRWQTAPFIVESYGWDKVFEAGLDGIVKQVEDYHISAIGNGNFNVGQWSDLPADKQAALLRSGDRAGYRYVPVTIQYRQTDDCALALKIGWRNDGVAPAYEPWRIHIRLATVSIERETVIDLPKIMPGETSESTACLDKIPSGAYDLQVQVIDPKGSGRTMALPLKVREDSDIYELGRLTVP
ncbi:MAG: DUF4832 domain-containing protein [Asticcacaulis sp.]|uniref:DUF4832 domain-containing protein n=1 Tax=Asticcacaulis sp. TaxID=1872648 RepID=UPI0039E6B8C6